MDAMEQARQAESVLKQIKECIAYKDPVGVKKFILEDKISDQTIFWELATDLCQCLTQENFENFEGFFDACERCLKYLIKNGNSKELLLALLEQADSFKDDIKFTCLLEGIMTLLLKLPNKRHHSLDIALETLSARVDSLPLPQEMNLEKHEKKFLLGMRDVKRICDVLLSYLNFLKPFVQEVSIKNPEANRDKSSFQIKLLTRYVLKLFYHPLVFLDLTFDSKVDRPLKSDSRKCAEQAIQLLAELRPNLFHLVEEELEKRERQLSGKGRKNKGKKNKNVNRNDTEEDEVADWTENEDVMETETLSCLLYLIQSEHLCVDNFPGIYTHVYMLHFHLRFISQLLYRNESLIIYKGVQLLGSLICKVAMETLTVEDLDEEEYTKVLNGLINVMVHCPVQDIRQECVAFLPSYIKMFSLPGRHRLYQIIFCTCKHSGVFGYVIHLLKEQVDSVLKQSSPDCNFIGINLFKLMKMASKLEEGATTDLLEKSDQVIAMLNMIRYLILRDSPNTNTSGLWDCMADIESEFFKPLRLGLDMSKSHYQLELQNVKQGKQSMGESSNAELNISVAGLPLPKMDKEQQIGIFEQALNTFDLIDSLLSRVIELIDVQKRGANNQ